MAIEKLDGDLVAASPEAMQAIADQSGADERAKFEFYLTSVCLRDLQELSTNEYGEYDDDEIDASWNSWQAALAYTQPAPQTIVPPVAQAPCDVLSADDYKLWAAFVTLREMEIDDVPLPDLIVSIRQAIASIAAPIVATVPSLLNAEEMAAFNRCVDCFDDGEGYDVPKSMMSRLASIGVLRHVGNGVYETTEFGMHIRLADIKQPDAAPSHTEQASDVRNAALEEVTRFIRNNYQDYPTIDSICNYILELKSLTPATTNISQEIDINQLVNRFLSWQLPQTFAPDCGISFKQVCEGSWPMGTNLFHAGEAKAMFEYCLATPSAKGNAPAEEKS